MSVKNFKLPKPAAIGFVILAGFVAWGLHVDSDNSRTTSRTAASNRALTVQLRNIQEQEAHDSCIGINKGYAATRLAKQATADVQVLQVEKLRQRFLDSNALNPATTPQQEAAFENGKKFFDGLVQDTKDLSAQALSRVEAATVPLDCPPPPSAAK